MPRSNKIANPFYVLLVIVGLSFALTATSYGVMAFREARPAAELVAANPATGKHPLMAWMSQHGERALLTELALLAACTFGAIGTDDYWQRRNSNPDRNAARKTI